MDTKRRIELTISMAVGLLSCAALASQSGVSATQTASPPTGRMWRTSWGDPDLEGSWSNATTTPLQRLAKYGTRELLTPEERAEADKPQRDVGRGERGATPEADLDGSYQQFWREGSASDGRTSLVFDPPDGRIPMTAEGEKRRAAFLRTDGLDSWEDRSLYDRCIMRGPVPRIPSQYNNNYEIVQTPGYVAILQEQIHDTRLIPLDRRPHLDPKVRQWLGDSRGRWEGDTLVVETTNFSDRTDFQGGGPHMRLTERWTRLTDDRIDYRFTVEDATAWIRPWSAAIAWNAVEPLFEYACHEGNYSLYNILEGARISEAEARAKPGK